MVTNKQLSLVKTMRPCWCQIAIGLAVILAVSAKPDFFGDIQDEEGRIDNLHDFMERQNFRSHALPHASSRSTPKNLDKIEFGVGPKDPRFDPKTHTTPLQNANSKYNIQSKIFNHPFYQGDIPAGIPPIQIPLNYQQPPPDYRYAHNIPKNHAYMQENLAPPMVDFNANNIPNMNPAYMQPNLAPMVDLNANNYRRYNDPALIEKQRIAEQLISTNKQNSKFNEHVPEVKSTEPVGHPHANYRKMDKVSVNEPSHQFVNSNDFDQANDFAFTALVAGCTTIAVFGVIGAGMCWYRLHKNQRAAADADYPAYGVTGPSKTISPGAADRKLAQSAHMYHYQHKKQQMIDIEKSIGGERQGSASDVDTDDEGEDGDYTVYECPGLASTGEMEVKNPLFQDEPTPATPAVNKEERQGTPEPLD